MEKKRISQSLLWNHHGPHWSIIQSHKSKLSQNLPVAINEVQ